MVRVPARARETATTAADLEQRLAGLPADERDRVLLDVVRGHVAAVLGHPSGQAVEPDRAFQELGFDSLAAVELRKRLSAAFGRWLPATLVFDHPTSRTLAGHLCAELLPAGGEPVLAEVDRLEAALAASSPTDDQSARITARLEALLRNWRDTRGGSAPPGTGTTYESATDDELFEVLDNLEIG